MKLKAAYTEAGIGQRNKENRSATAFQVKQPNLKAQPQCLQLTCPIQFVLKLLGSKWAILIVRELFRGDRRTHELLEALPGISSKTLTIRLRELEEYGLVARQVYPEVPPHVEYSLTQKGKSVRPVMKALKEVGEQWLQQNCCNCLQDS